ncbi:MAG: flagellar biosynthesis protein FlhB [Bacillota bacterium]
MAADSKTEKATPKKRKDERKKGNLLTSKDIITVVSMIGIFGFLQLYFPTMVQEVYGFIHRIFYIAGTNSEFTEADFTTLTVDALRTIVIVIGPLAIMAMLMGIIASIAQTGLIIVWDSLKPKFNRMNPIEGIKKLFSFKSLFDLLKNFIKILILLAIMLTFLSDLSGQYIKALDWDITISATVILSKVIALVFRIVIAFLVISIADYAFQKWEYERKMKMSKQEIKDEHKNMEGDPKVKGKIKQLQRQMAMQRMMQSVPDADVVVRNPTHFAVALKYDADSSRAPVVVAKGQDEMALRIIKVAEEAGVVVMENVPLARALYATSDLDREISPEFYGTVAEILVYVYKLKNKKLL